MLTQKEKSALLDTAKKLNVKYDDLYNLINFESRFKPFAKNPRSSARGLIQFTDNTARSLGFKTSADLVSRYPTVTEQLKPVYVYLKQFYPFKNKQSLFMSVFYPRYRNVHPKTLFPESVRKVNPGINTPQDYINKVEGKLLQKIPPLIILLGIAYIMYRYHFNKSGGGNNGEKESAGDRTGNRDGNNGEGFKESRTK